MWEESFIELVKQQSGLSGRIGRGQIRLGAVDGTLRESPVVNVTNTICTLPFAHQSKRRLFIQSPDMDASFARSVVVALIFAELAWRGRQSKDSITIDGDILFVTQQIIKCRQMLDSITVGGTHPVSLGQNYRIVSFSGREKGSDNRSLYLANPGRLADLESNKFGAVLIDGSHPRTMVHLSQLLSIPSIAECSLQIVLSPPQNLDSLSTPESAMWLWDPISKQQIDNALQQTNTGVDIIPRHYWFASDDELEANLSQIHLLLSGAMKLTGRKPPGALLQAWRIYNQFRNLTVELAYLERSYLRLGYKRSLQDQIKQLLKDEVQVGNELGTYLSLYWPLIMQKLEEVHILLSDRSEPDKFYVIGDILSSHFNASSEPIRVVTTSHLEALLLEERLEVLLTGFKERSRTGNVRIIHQAHEARIISEEGHCYTVLAGMRPSMYRYLDLFNPEPINIVTYAYEALIDKRAVKSLYTWGELKSSEEAKLRVLDQIGVLQSKAWEIPKRDTMLPGFKEHNAGKSRVKQFADMEPEPVTFLWTHTTTTGYQSHSTSGDEAFLTNVTGDYVELIDTEERIITFPAERRVDAYYPETHRIRRIKAEDVRIGDYIVVLVDDWYEELFARLRQIIAQRRSPIDTLYIRRWQFAKRKLISKYNNDFHLLWQELVRNGISVGQSQIRYWFYEESEEEDDDHGMAPRSYNDFCLLAKLSDEYERETDLFSTFEAIESERANRRRWGKLLKKSLRAIVDGVSYENALADAINSPVDEVLLAVQVREIGTVRRVRIS